jgi:hypothetical protein
MRFVPNFTIRCQPLGRYRAVDTLGRRWRGPWGDKVWGFGENSVQVIDRGRGRSVGGLVEWG